MSAMPILYFEHKNSIFWLAIKVSLSCCTAQQRQKRSRCYKIAFVYETIILFLVLNSFWSSFQVTNWWFGIKVTPRTRGHVRSADVTSVDIVGSNMPDQLIPRRLDLLWSLIKRMHSIRQITDHVCHLDNVFIATVPCFILAYQRSQRHLLQ